MEAVPLRVMKFGGTSLAGAVRLRAVAKLVLAAAREERVLVVASAMAGITDLLAGALSEAEGRAPVIEAEGQAPVIEAAGRAPVIEAAGRAPVIEAAGQAPVIEAAGQAPVIEAAGRAPIAEAEGRAPVPDAAEGGAAGRAVCSAPEGAAERFAAAHRAVLKDLRPDLGEAATLAVERRLAGLTVELARLLEGTAILRTCPPVARARVCALGERASCALLGALLRVGGMGADEMVELDPAAVILCEGDPLEATPLPALLRQRLAPFRAGGARLGLLPGFFGGRAPQGGSPGGEVMLLGRGGSDLSAALAAAALDARLLEIWTDVDGIYTADPRLVPTAACLAELSFEEAMELAHFGAKVLHPRTIASVRTQAIPVRVRNSLAPERPGTLVHTGAAPNVRPARGISLLRGVALLDVSGPAMRGVPGTAARIFAALAARDINIVLITQGSSEADISVCVAAAGAAAAVDALDRAFAMERAAGWMDAVALRRGLAILSLVGDGMRHQAGVAGALFGALGDLGCNVAAIAQGSSERSISAVLAEEEGTRAMEAVHGRFFNGAERLELYLLGVGLVGSQLLVQLGRQQERLRQRGVDLRLCAVARSRRMLVDPAGLEPETAVAALAEEGEPLDLAALREAVRRRRPACPVLVDCTSSAELAAAYGEFAAAGFHLVGANKKLNSGALGDYRALGATMGRHPRPGE
jgi:bifunctional aspartokinase / homoserine dehydrogenase 1